MLGKKFWPDPLISINPHFEKGDNVDELAKTGAICMETRDVFRIKRKPITLHRHQSEALAKAKAEKVSSPQQALAPESLCASSFRSLTMR